MIDILE